MTNRKNLSVNSVEFEDIKTNLKTFLQGQETFKGYDFEGSALSTLIDVLAYNTYYQAFYNNVTANEMFLDSAVKRSSIVSLAKAIGYTPNSKTAASATVDLTYGSNPGTTTLLPGAVFTTKIANKTYTFVNTESATITSTGGTYKVSDLNIKEGSLSSVTYVVPDATNNNKYIISDPNADISTVKVRVQSSQTDTTGLTDVWSRSTDLTTVTATSNVYFIEENTEGKFEIFFGDGVIGKKPETGNVVTVTYLITNGAEANGAGNDDSAGNRSFRYLNANNTVEVKSVASGGGEKETVDQIRFKAPRSFTTQNRAVTKNDYSSLVETNFTGFDSVFVYGGEEADPPSYGSVFIALKPSSGTIVSDSKKKEVQDFLRTKAVLSVLPVVVDPNYTFIRLGVDVSYDATKTSLSVDSITSSVRSNVISNINANLGKFAQSFAISKMLTDIDSASTSIDSSAVTVTMEKRILPTSNQAVSYVLNFGNPITHPHDGHKREVFSNTFKFLDSDSSIKNVFLEDDGFGNISFFETVNGDRVLVSENIGTVDYENGIIRINQVQVLSPDETPYISVFANGSNKRYISVRDQLIVSDYESDASAISIVVNGIEQVTSTGLNQSVAVSGLQTVTSTSSGGSSSSSLVGPSSSAFSGPSSSGPSSSGGY